METRPTRLDVRKLFYGFLLCGLLVSAGPLVSPVAAQSRAERDRLVESETPIGSDWTAQLDYLQRAAYRLPIATILASILAFRPRRRGTPPRQTTVIHTQIILAIVGGMVMLVVGSSLARAFGIVGAAGLIRYRAKVDDPKDAGVMLSTLALGLASGVGLYLLAAFAVVFVLVVLWILESIEPEPSSVFELTVKAKDVPPLRRPIQRTLKQHGIGYELRGTGPDMFEYEVRVPNSRNTDAVTSALMSLDKNQPLDVKWEKKKEK